MNNNELMVLAAAAVAVWMIVRKTSSGTGNGFVAPERVRKTGELNGITTFSDGVMIDENGVYYDANGYAIWAPGMFP